VYKKKKEKFMKKYDEFQNEKEAVLPTIQNTEKKFGRKKKNFF